MGAKVVLYFLNTILNFKIISKKIFFLLKTIRLLCKINYIFTQRG